MQDDSENSLEYGILGFDTRSEEEKIAKYTGDVDWEYLKPHFKAGNMIYVDPTLDLQETAKAFVEDNRTAVDAWLKAGDILQPGSLHADWWEHDRPRFNAAIVQPFVLAQPLASENDSKESIKN